MSTILYLAHTECDGTLHKIALETLTAAKALAEGMGADLAVGLVGADVAAAADSIAGCGAKFYGVSGPDFNDARYGSDLAAAEAIAKACSAEIVVAPATSRFSRALPGLAIRLDGRVDTHLSGLEAKDGKPVAKRWFYRQRMEGTLTREERPWVLTLDSGCADAFAGAGSADGAPRSLAWYVRPRTSRLFVPMPNCCSSLAQAGLRSRLMARSTWT